MDAAVTPDDLRQRGGLKWTGHDEGVLAAWVAEMDYGLAPSIKDALHDAVDRGDTAYFYPEIERRVAEAATTYWHAEFGWSVDPGRVFSVPDVVEGIRRAVIHLTEPDSPVVLHTPVYFPFFSMIDRAGRELVEVPSKIRPDGQYHLDTGAIEKAFADGAGSIVLCNPWNPTGRSFTDEEIDEITGLASRHGARVVSDEIHAPLTYDGVTHVPAASVAPDVVVTVTSASKAWNLPGLKCGQMVFTNDRDVEVWSEYYTSDKVGVGTFGLIANAAAYDGGRVWLEEAMTRLAENRALLGNLVSTHLPNVGYTEPQATYLAWLDFSRHELDDPADFLLDGARVALTAGPPFGHGGVAHARLNFATYPDILTDIVERIAAALWASRR